MTTWRRERLKHLASVRVSNVDKKTAEGELVVRLCNYTDVYYNDSITAGLPFMEATATADQAARFALRRGDTVITKDSETADDIAVPAFVAEDMPGIVCGYHLAVIRPKPGVDPKYLYWCLASSALRDQFSVDATGVTRFGLRSESIANARIAMPDVATQRTLADFLDAETARIDALLTRCERLIKLIGARPWQAFVNEVSRLAGAPRVPIRRTLVSICDGPFGSAFSSGDYVADGAAVIRLGNIGFGKFRSADLARIPLTMFQEFRRHEVRRGDVLIAGLGDERNHAGRATVAPDLGPAIVKGKCFCARVDSTVASAAYLALYLSSSLGAEGLSVETRGSTRMMINLEILKSSTMPLPPIEVQDCIVRAFEEGSNEASRLTVSMARQAALLREHRQALITAAVTGEIDVKRKAS